MSKRLTLNQKLWQKEIRRLEGYQRKLESKGITFKKSPIPQAKSRITRIALAKISSITYSDIASKGYIGSNKYIPKTKSKPRKSIFNLEEERERYRQQHIKALKDYREKVEIRRRLTELKNKQEKWTPEEMQEMSDLIVKERDVLSKKEKKKKEQAEKEYNELNERIYANQDIPVDMDEEADGWDKEHPEPPEPPEVDYYQELFDQIRNIRENPNVRLFLLTKLMSFKQGMNEVDRRKELNANIKANKASIDIEVVHLSTISGDTKQRVANAVKLYRLITNDNLDLSDRIRLTKCAEEDQTATQY